MLKQILLASLLFTASLSLSAQKPANPLISQDFWQAKPTLSSVQAEVAKGYSPSEPNGRMMDPTTLAILSGATPEVVDYLVRQQGNSVDKKTHHYRTYLHWAALKGDRAIVKLLLDRGANIYTPDEHGNTPLTYAVGSGMHDRAVIELFTSAGYDLKARSRSGATLLLLAIAGDKHFVLTDYFLSKGLSLSDVDASGASAFDYATQSGSVEHLRAVLARGARPTAQAISMAAGGRGATSGLDVYKYLVEELKQDPKTLDKNGNTLLHLIATKPRQSDIAAYLVGLGVPANAANVDGNTPLILAAGGRDPQLVEYLLTVSQLEQANLKGETALTRAVSYGTPAVVKLLLDRGANVQVRDVNGHNLTYYLAQGYREPMPSSSQHPQEVAPFDEKLSLLAQAGLDIKAAQPDGSTLYHYAASRGSLSMLEAVAKLGLDINAINDEGLTALHKAALTAKDTRVLRRLVELGADKTLRTELDETAYDLARENGYLQRSGEDISFLK